MSLKRVKETYLTFLRKVRDAHTPPSHSELFPILAAAGEFGRCLAAVGLYTDIAHDAGEFVKWIEDERQYDSDSSFICRAQLVSNQEEVVADIPLPVLKSGELFDFDNSFISDQEEWKSRLNGRNPVGVYFLHLAALIPHAEIIRPRFLEDLASGFENDTKLSLALLARAAEQYFWEARKQLEDPFTGEPYPEPEGALERPQADNVDPAHHLESSVTDDEACLVDGDSQKRATRGKWRFLEDEEPSKTFYTVQSIHGTLLELSMCFYRRSKAPDERRVKNNMKKGRVCVRKHSGQHYEMFAKSESSYKEFKGRLDAWKASQNSTHQQ